MMTPDVVAENALADITKAALDCALAYRMIQRLDDQRASEKSAAIRRLMGTDNPETGKPHSASSAEKIVETDPEYRAFRERQAEAEVEKWRSLGAWEAAKHRAALLEATRSAQPMIGRVLLSDAQLLALVAGVLDAGSRNVLSPEFAAARAHDLLVAASWLTVERPVNVHDAKPGIHRPGTREDAA